MSEHIVDDVRYVDIDVDAFPMRVEYIDDDTDELLQSIDVPGPGFLEIPGFAPRRVRVKITSPDGRWTIRYPDGVELHSA
jgi:hypothetical protein